MTLVPNRFPVLPLTPSFPRIALIGEAPGENEARVGQPFVGKSGMLLSFILSRSGVAMNTCFLGNVFQNRPPENNIELFNWTDANLLQLKNDIDTFNPNIIVLLGNIPLKAALDPLTIHTLKPKKYAYKNHDWRGSLFLAHKDSPFAGRKCLSTIHPAYVLRVEEHRALFDFDIRKAVRESRTPTLKITPRNITIAYEPNQAIRLLKELQKWKRQVALDIEGGINSMSCISFAVSAQDAFVIPFFKKDYSQCYSLEDECKVFKALAECLEDVNVPKVLQNSLYDTFILHYSYGITIKNVVDDTMLKHWELYSEIPKSLGTQTSIYTDQPFYKGDRTSQDDETFYRYCAMDSLVTYEINQKLEGWIAKTSRTHYKLNVSLLCPLRYMELKGINYDIQTAAKRRALIREKMFEAQARLNALTGCRFSWSSLKEIREYAQEVFCYKRDRTRVRIPYIASHARFTQLLTQPLTLASIGEIEDLCEVSLNEGSTKQTIHYLYETLGLPRQYNKSKDKAPGLTTDYEALLNLSAHCKRGGDSFERSYQIIQRIIEIRAMDTRQRMLAIAADFDKRIRCGYNIVGSETGRITCYTSPTGSGYNLQTIPKYTKSENAPGGVIGDRDLFLADEGYYLFQCDLSGADGWTVAAYCAMLGDDTMLEDYRFGLKPAKLLALLLREESRAYDWNDRKVLKELSKSIDQDDWNYFACKRVQHGANYLEGPETIRKNILSDSEGKLVLAERDCRRLRDIYFCRYPGIQKWHNFIASQIKQRPFLTAASGQVRQFFGHPNEILTKAIAHEPQANTTYATNLAMYKLWTDNGNRFTSGNENMVSNRPSLHKTNLRIQPLHQVHDALIGQFLISDTQWAVGKIKSYFNNTLNIAGYSIVIPFEGGYGRSWGELKNVI